MPDKATTLATLVVAFMIATSVSVSVVTLSTPAAAAQTVSNQRDIASHTDSTTQKFSFEFDRPPKDLQCTLKTSNSLEQYGVKLKSATVTGTDALTLNVKSNGNIEMTLKSGSGTETATVALTMSTENVQIPDEPQNHQADCGGTPSASVAGVAPVTAQQSGFEIQETGIKNTSDTAIHSDDKTIENDTTLTQSIDLDLLVPDDGDGDGDTYNVTIDTQQALANGINVTGASLETDPSGSSSQVEVVETAVEADENVTVRIREAAADRNDGNVSRETVTVALDLDGTQHSAGTFTEDVSIEHVISDDAGNTTSRVTFSSSIPTTVDQSPTANAGADTTVAITEAVTLDASGSTDDQGISSYEWDVDGDGDFELTGETASHNFSTLGAHVVTLKVTDGAGQSDTDTTTVTVVRESELRPTTVDVLLEGAPNGLRKYSVNVSGPAGGNITAVTRQIEFGTFQTEAGGEGHSFVTAREVSFTGGAEAFTGNKTLVTIEFERNHSADAFSVEVLALTDLNGNDIDSSRVSLDVQEPTANPFDNAVPGAGAADPPTDPDGDGLYDDVNGDGEATFDDAIALAFASTGGFTQAQVEALDFDGDGDVDFDDAIELAFST